MNIHNRPIPAPVKSPYLAECRDAQDKVMDKQGFDFEHIARSWAREAVIRAMNPATSARVIKGERVVVTYHRHPGRSA